MFWKEKKSTPKEKTCWKLAKVGNSAALVKGKVRVRYSVEYKPEKDEKIIRWFDSYEEALAWDAANGGGVMTVRIIHDYDE